jgi:hypothetical protein
MSATTLALPEASAQAHASTYGARLLQGAAAALMVPQVLSVVQLLYNAEERGPKTPPGRQVRPPSAPRPPRHDPRGRRHWPAGFPPD